MATRMCKTTCQNARMLLRVFSPYDRLAVLDIIKRYLTDSQTKLGEEYISSMFPFEKQKKTVLSVLQTVQSDKKNIFPAGGHKINMNMGTTYSMCLPNDIHKYGSIEKQLQDTSSHIMKRQGKTFYPPGYVHHKSDVSNADEFDYEGTNSYPGMEKHLRSRVITLREKDSSMPLGCIRTGKYPDSLPYLY
ncbi:Hypothetical predicted protein [Octopus vulgaris]|uniref:Uncharacterized protein n=1 Tax=Octopus vulgaris TaxID=6645 RepID=A0AA36AHV2_OCTVU|nr:Hypothetical predicted protein [Octopus vulgaris]